MQSSGEDLRRWESASAAEWRSEASPERDDGHDNQRQLPFCFGCEIETMVRPKTSTGLTPLSEQRRYNFNILKVIARAMTDAGLACQVFDPAEQEFPDYTVWNVMLDASLSKHHICYGFYPVDIVSPIIMADERWTTILDSF
ncbi:hypothetical protein GGR55DRAFT_697416 [Xylaria sp. FL0064]|nr:hypothetical protein GGR55DRAFT_697416 [Xylaria sp. FL0064]